MHTSARRVVAFCLAALAGTTVAGTASAHVRYVVDDPADVASIVEFVTATVADPVNAALLAGGALAAGGTVLAYERFRPFPRDRAVFAVAMADYRDLVPWLLRLSLGIPLVGAGFTGYYFSPLAQIDFRVLFVGPRVLFIGLGFLLLFGLATRAVALFTLALYLAGVVLEPVLLLQFEFVGGLVALALVGGGRPSGDDVLDRVAAADGTVYGRIDPVHGVAVRFRDRVAPYERYAPVVVRVGLAVAFAYLGVVEKLLNPGYGLAVVAEYDLTAVVPVAPELWVLGAALAEVAVGVVLALGLYTRGAAALSLALFTLTLFGLPDDPVLAHLSLFGLASALIITGAGPLSLDRALAAEADAAATDHTDAVERA